MTLELPLLDVFGRGGSLKSSWYGDCLPSRDFPMLVEQYKLGRLDLDAFVTERIGLADIEEAFHKMHEGKGPALRGGSGDYRTTQDPRTPCHLRHLQPGRRDLGRGQQRLDHRRRHRGASSSTRPRTRGRSRTPSGTAPSRPSCSPTATTTTSAHARELRPAGRRTGPPEPGRCGPLGSDLPRHRPGRARSTTGTPSRLPAPPWSPCTPRATPRAPPASTRTAGTLFSGDTLFNGGPGATGRCYCDFDTLIDSIRKRLLTLPAGHRRPHRPRGMPPPSAPRAPNLADCDRARPLGPAPPVPDGHARRRRHPSRCRRRRAFGPRPPTPEPTAATDPGAYGSSGGAPRLRPRTCGS